MGAGWCGARGGMSHVQSGHSSTFHHSIVLTPGCWWLDADGHFLKGAFIYSIMAPIELIRWIETFLNAALYGPVTGRIFSMAVNLLLLHYSHF